LVGLALSGEVVFELGGEVFGFFLGGGFGVDAEDGFGAGGADVDPFLGPLEFEAVYFYGLGGGANGLEVVPQGFPIGWRL
jgi:hypothetical protein